jgi:hypothetical protein
MVNTLFELPTSMSCPPNSDLVTTSVHAFSNKKKLEASKGLDHFDLSLLSQLAFLLLSISLDHINSEPHQASTRTQVPDYTL